MYHFYNIPYQGLGSRPKESIMVNRNVGIADYEEAILQD